MFGSIARPYFYDLTAYLALDAIDIKYRFQENYTDLCNPANPNCATGVICADCNAGYDPHYVVSAYVINFSNQILGLPSVTAQQKESLQLTAFPNPTNGLLKLNLKGKNDHYVVNVLGIDGTAIKTYHFQSIDALNNYTFALQGIAAGTYFVKVNSSSASAFERIIIR